MTQSRFHPPGWSLLLASGLSGLLAVTVAQGQEMPSDREAIIHVLNRITFGPRPGDVEAVEKMGLHAYVEQQLHPETIDDSAVEQQVAVFDLLQKSPQELTDLFLEEKKEQEAKKKALLAANAANGDRQQQPGVQ